MLRFRASPSGITKVNKNLTLAQRRRVQREGEIAALLDIPCGRMPAEFASWLMSECFDLVKSELVLPGRGRIAVTAEAVSRVLGLRNSGDPVRYELDAEAIKFMTEQYGLERGIAPNIDTIIERLSKSREADDDFFRSWLMIVVSTFLCPTTGLSISSKCYPPLVDLSVVKNLNWCQFVVDQFKISAQETNKKNSVRGCLYFIVILYADSLDVTTVQIPGTEPRIANLHILPTCKFCWTKS